MAQYLALDPKVAEELFIYHQLFEKADVDKKGVIEGQNAVNFFNKSGLPKTTLREIWTLADSNNKGYLTREEFIIAVKLVAKAQNGQDLNLANINTGGCLPRLDRNPVDNVGFAIPNEVRERYKQIFVNINPDNGVFGGEKAKQFFSRSKLPIDKLSQIWNLTDTKHRGNLDLAEFVIAMYFVENMMNGTIKVLPKVLPNGLYENEMRMVKSGIIDSQNNGYVQTKTYTIANQLNKMDNNCSSVFQNPIDTIPKSENLEDNTLLPKCLTCKVKYVYPRSHWCSISCKERTPNWQNPIIEHILCLYCGKDNLILGQDFCSDLCDRYVRNNAPMILKLPEDNQKYKDVSNQFIQSWKHPEKDLPEIYSIWKIYCTETLSSQYRLYREKVEGKQLLSGKPFPKGNSQRLMSAGNEQRRFHGTKTACSIGIGNSNHLCSNKSCSVCCIIRKGIYFSATSSKSDDYNTASLTVLNNISYKVMLLNKVVVGKGYSLTNDNGKLSSPPTGYDSILGEPSANGSLNYDEIVVFKDEASIPQYLIVYKGQPEFYPNASDQPISNESLDQPISNESLDQPISNESLDQPISNESLDQPISNESLDQPISNESLDQPISNESLDQPISNESLDQPISNEIPSQLNETLSQSDSEETLNKSISEETSNQLNQTSVKNNETSSSDQQDENFHASDTKGVIIQINSEIIIHDKAMSSDTIEISIKNDNNEIRMGNMFTKVELEMSLLELRKEVAEIEAIGMLNVTIILWVDLSDD
ncbi:28710_t:CDS:10 [Dentiscutata erythropus]|uniref:28710_t:CDS:1 n=1 Tax=Dentiscutata erythropus TaxID=1348616 RepID=A0A9N8ZBM0_9GLOM|nr:28710_t:CDS:10 [Dentiscutata erythropus]